MLRRSGPADQNLAGSFEPGMRFQRARFIPFYADPQIRRHPPAIQRVLRGKRQGQAIVIAEHVMGGSVECPRDALDFACGGSGAASVALRFPQKPANPFITEAGDARAGE